MSHEEETEPEETPKEDAISLGVQIGELRAEAKSLREKITKKKTQVSKSKEPESKDWFEFTG